MKYKFQMLTSTVTDASKNKRAVIDSCESSAKRIKLDHPIHDNILFNNNNTIDAIVNSMQQLRFSSRPKTTNVNTFSVNIQSDANKSDDELVYLMKKFKSANIQ